MILIASSRESVRRHYREALKGAEQILETTDLESLAQVLEHLQSTIVFVDAAMDGVGDFRRLRSLCVQHRQIAFALVGCDKTLKAELDCLRAGVRGVVAVDCPPEMLRKAVAKISHRELWFSRKALASFLEELGFLRSSQPSSEVSVQSLSDRELQVVRLTITGASNKEIGASLGITERTVKAHISHIFNKLGLRQRTELFLLEERLLSNALVRQVPEEPGGELPRQLI